MSANEQVLPDQIPAASESSEVPGKTETSSQVDIGSEQQERPAELAIVPDKLVSTVHSPVPQPTVQAPDEILIDYRPFAGTEQWLKYRFSAWSTFKAWFAMLLVVVFFGFGGPAFIVSQMSLLTLQGAGTTGTGMAAANGMADSHFLLSLLAEFLGLLTATSASIYLMKPTHIGMSRKGISLQWNHWRFAGKTVLPWSSVERIDVAWPPGKTSPQDCMIRFKSNTGSGKEYPISVRLGAISTMDERDKLLKGIEAWAGEVSRDPQLLEMLTPAQDHSYTELWLQALSAPPKRERLTPLSPGAKLQEEKYEVLSQLGVGGQGTAYFAVTANNHKVVLKEFILPVYVDVNVRRQALEKMQHEAAILRRLDNNRVVKLIEFFVEDHRGYLVLECIDGFSLRTHVNENGPLEEKRVRELAQQMCGILTYLHSLEPPVVHRDFTPDNLILGSDGILKLVDFNVAQQTECTATGTVVGKHAYLPPEQFRGRPTTQSDIYAMGATLYFLLAGEDPEPITSSHPARTSAKPVSAELDALVAKATALDCGKRYKDISELEKDLG